MDLEELCAYLQSINLDYSGITSHTSGTDAIYMMEIPSEIALNSWRIISQDSRFHYWPILGAWQSNGLDWNLPSFNETNMILESAMAIDTDIWLSNELTQLTSPRHFGDHPLVLHLPLSFTVLDKYAKQKSRIPLTLIPTKKSWQAAAYLHYSTPDGPSSTMHTAMWKRWYETSAANVIFIEHATVEFMVSHPPLTAAIAEKLAIEHYIYCGDIVAQWAYSIENLTTILKDSTVWHFWWD